MNKQRLDELQTRQRRLINELDEVERAIARERDSCAHVRGEWLDGRPAWWCEKCGGEIPSTETPARHSSNRQ